MILSFPNDQSLADAIAHKAGLSLGNWSLHTFPDGESLVRLLTDIEDQKVAVVCSLDQVNSKIMPLIFLAASLRDQGAKTISLVCPYLAYMRQDKSFRTGEANSARIFGHLISSYFDQVLTVDPHLHRYPSLDNIYSVPSIAISAAQALAEWIQTNIKKPILIGPDEESRQWVEAVAKQVKAPFTVLEKTRHGDRKVEISVPDISSYSDYTPLLLDDMVSTARTMIEAVKHVRSASKIPPVCVAVHGLFVEDSYEQLKQAGVGGVVTANSVPHISNQIDLSSLIAAELTRALAARQDRDE